MKITVFTSNQSRHLSLVEGLASIAEEVFVVQECNTVFPGQVDDFFNRTDVMQSYFKNVIEAENEIFGSIRFLPSNVKSLSVKMGDLNKLTNNELSSALESDYYIVFGSSYIKGDLIDFLVKNRAINIHMGLSPYYRGSSCNFWALYDGRPEYVGATIHLLSKGLDSGEMLFHAVPEVQKVAPFVLGMMAVRAAHNGLISVLQSGEIKSMVEVRQDRELEIRYTRNSDFTDEVAMDYLQNAPTEKEVYEKLKNRNLSELLKPHIC